MKPDSGRGRYLKARVRSAKKRKPSSTRWLQRQINDPYVKLARQKGLRGRAAFKLLELNDKFRFLAPGDIVVDLGCAPGGWCQIASAKVNSAGRPGQPKGRVIGIDLKPIDPIEGVESYQLDFLDNDSPIRIRELASGPVDAVLSDMATPSTGHRQTDHLKIMALCEAAAEFAIEVLAEGGTFVSKVLAGGAEASLQTRLKENFAKCSNVKPPASRSDSSEKYVVARGFRPSKKYTS
ncbi:MAG: RlmE family RNA methyltransferase [Albidovulum sp.]|nr:RlmE family RNA methyltransferase [Albidovulum sp.]MDE0530996.1 RlmE family RNA methyltransferase [Albidovulum sp.]